MSRYVCGPRVHSSEVSGPRRWEVSEVCQDMRPILRVYLLMLQHASLLMRQMAEGSRIITGQSCVCSHL